MSLLEGKCVAMTGGGDGLGRCYGLAMARAGASIAVADIDEKAAARESFRASRSSKG